jgi:hypothetical protein
LASRFLDIARTGARTDTAEHVVTTLPVVIDSLRDWLMLTPSSGSFGVESLRELGYGVDRFPSASLVLLYIPGFVGVAAAERLFSCLVRTECDITGGQRTQTRLMERTGARV